MDSGWRQCLKCNRVGTSLFSRSFSTRSCSDHCSSRLHQVNSHHIQVVVRVFSMGTSAAALPDRKLSCLLFSQLVRLAIINTNVLKPRPQKSPFKTLNRVSAAVRLTEKNNQLGSHIYLETWSLNLATFQLPTATFLFCVSKSV